MFFWSRLQSYSLCGSSLWWLSYAIGFSLLSVSAVILYLVNLGWYAIIPLIPAMGLLYLASRNGAYDRIDEQDDSEEAHHLVESQYYVSQLSEFLDDVFKTRIESYISRKMTLMERVNQKPQAADATEIQDLELEYLRRFGWDFNHARLKNALEDIYEEVHKLRFFGPDEGLIQIWIRYRTASAVKIDVNAVEADLHKNQNLIRIILEGHRRRYPSLSRLPNPLGPSEGPQQKTVDLGL